MKIVNQLKREKNGKKVSYSRVYFFPANETVLDQFSNRRARLYDEYRKLLPLALMAEGVPGDVSRDAIWSQKAGCSCGCSPGFIVKRNVSALSGSDLFVTVE